MRRIKTARAMRVGAAAVGAFALGAFAVGTLAIGTMAIGRLAIGRLAAGRATLKSLRIDELTSGISLLTRNQLEIERLPLLPSQRTTPR